MGKSYKKGKFSLFKGNKRISLIYTFLLFFLFIISFHYIDGINNFIDKSICNFRCSIYKVIDNLSKYLNNLKYNFSGESGRMIFFLQNENLMLKSEIEKLKLLEKDNNELREKLELKKNISEKIVVARVFSIFCNDFSKVALIDKGIKEGIKVDDFAFCEEGLLGRVIEISDHWSKILLIIDSNSNIPAKINGIDCMINGDNTNNLKISLLNGDIKEGNIVETSGYGNIFREKIIIGKVKKINDEYFVVPSVNFNNLKYVCIDKCKNR